MRNLLKSKYLLSILLISIWARQICLAQNWEKVGGGLSWYIGDMNVDPSTNSLFIGGGFHYADTINCAGIINWDGSSFSKLNLPIYNCGTFNCQPAGSIIRYQNRLFMMGHYGPFNNGNDEELFEYINNNWQVSCSINGSLQNLKIINNKLFALGIYDSLCHKKINSLSVFNGTDWETFHNSPPGYWFYTGEYYKNEYYFGGNFENATNGNNEIVKWTGTQWAPLKTGIHGGFAVVSCMKVFKDILYVGGYYYKSDGNAADCLMAWDGQNWFNPFPQVTFIDFVNDLEVINDQLYISGNYIVPSANDSNMYVLARYNGCDLNVFGGTYKFPDYEKAPRCLAGLKGRIYAAVNDSFLHKSAEYLVSIPENTPNTKTIHISDCPKVVTYSDLNIFPNPFKKEITVQIPDNFILSETKFIVTNNLGQILLTFYPDSVNQVLNFSSFSSSMYFLTVQDNFNKKVFKVIKEE